MDFPPDLVKGSITPLVLALLKDRPMYGYEMVKTLDARSNGALAFKEGTLYPTLHKLEGEGLIEGEWRDPASATDDDDAGNGHGGGGSPAVVGAGVGGKPRKYYGLTRKGHTELERRAKEYRAFQSHVLNVLPG